MSRTPRRLNRPARLSAELLEDRVTPAAPGGTTVAVGDLDGDRVPDLIAAGGPGLGAVVQAFSGQTGRPLFAGGPFNPYPGEDFTSIGLYVAAGDVDADGRAELFVSPDLGGGARVQAFSLVDGQLTRRANFFAIDDPNFRGGGRIATADVDGDGRQDLIAGAGFSGGPRVAVYGGRSLAAGGSAPVRLFNDFFAFEPTLRDGVYTAAGDLNADGKAELIFGGGPGGGPRVLAIDPVPLFAGQFDRPFAAPVVNQFVFDSAARNGVIVAVGNTDADAGTEFLAAEGPGTGRSPLVGVFGPDGTPEGTVNVGFDPALGFRLAAGDFSGDGAADVIAAPASGPGRVVRAFRRDGTLLFELTDPFAADARIPPATSPPAAGLQLMVAPSSVSEAAGPAAAQLTVTRAGSLAAAASVQLTSGNPAAVSLPATAVIPAGAAAVTVPVGVTDNTLTDGPRTVALTAAADGLGAATAVLTITDDETGGPTAGSAAGLLAWNEVLLDAVRGDAAAPPVATRAMAMVNDALFDADNGLAGRPGYLVALAPSPGADPDAAAAAAGHRVLSELFPAQQARFDAERDRQLGLVADGPAKDAGAAYGRAVADAVVALRRDDGSDGFATYTPGTAVGAWEPTAPMFAPAQLPEYATVRPFALDRPDQLRPAAPPAVGSAEWVAAYEDVKTAGETRPFSETDTPAVIARVWADGSGTATPPGRWVRIAVDAARARNLSRADTARLLAALGTALADTSVAAWDAKYTFGTWRPITAIQEADRIGDPALVPDPEWVPLLITPNHPEYVSGHSSYSRAAATVLERFFGPEYAFSTSTVFAGQTLTRSFAGFSAAADEAGRSRIFGGIHFEFSNQAGQQLGRSVAEAVLATFDPADDAIGPAVTFDRPSGTPTADPTVAGRVTDRQSGVRELTARVDGGDPVGVPLDRATGTFTFAPPLTADGTYTVEFTAVDLGGRASTTSYTLPLDRTGPVVALTGELPQITAIVNDPAGLIALRYSLDEPGTATDVPIPFDPAGGTITFAPDLSRSTPGSRTLTVTAVDAAGNTASNTLAVELAARPALTVTDTLPRDGAADVGVTYRPRLFFSRPVENLSAANVVATAADGRVIPTRPVPADDGSFAWVYFPDGLPGGTAVTLRVDGNGADADPADDLRGKADGTPLTGEPVVRFTTVSTIADPGLTVAEFGPTGPGEEEERRTVVTGVVADPGPDLKPGTPDDVLAGPDGRLMTTDDKYLSKLAGVKVFALGREGEAVFTDENGVFTLSVPAGVVKLVVDGRTATNPPAGLFFPEMVLDLALDPLAENTAMGSMGTPEQQAANEEVKGLYLPRLADEMMTPVDPDAETAVRATAAASPNLTPAERDGLRLTVPAGATALDEAGEVMTATEVGISTVPPELVREMLPPGVMQHTFDITIQAPGVSTFATPLPLTVPNTFAAAPGTRLNLISFDHTTGRLEIEGTMTVSADGKTVTTDPGVGITHPGWSGAAPPGSTIHGKPLNAVNPEDICNDPRYEKLLNELYSDEVRARLDALLASGKYNLQPLGSRGSGITVGLPYANYDKYSVTIPASRLPAGFDPIVELARWPSDMNAVPKPGSSGSSDFNDVNVFAVSRLPVNLGDIIDINIPLYPFPFRESPVSVMLTEQEDNRIRFSTLSRPDRGLFHPVSGSREFGFVRNSDGSLTFYTQAVDSPTVLSVQLLGGPEQKKGWEGFLRGFAERFGYTDAEAAALVAAGSFPNQQLADEPDCHVRPDGSRPASGAQLAVFDALEDSATEGRVPEKRIQYWKLSYYLHGGGPKLESLAGQVDAGEEIRVFLPPRASYTLYVYDAATERWGQTDGTSPGSTDATFGPIYLGLTPGEDRDGDGLGEVAEFIIGSNPASFSTTDDGISDGAKVRQGRNPLGTRQAQTGVVGRVPLAGPARSVAVADRTAYVTTNDSGLAVVDVSDPASPVVLGEIDLDVNDDAFGNQVLNRVAVDPVTGTVVVAGGDRPAFLVDVSDPANPTVRTVARPSSLPNPEDASDERMNVRAVAAAGGLVFVADRFAVRVFEPLTGTELSRVPIFQVAGLAVEAGRLYALTLNGNRPGVTPGQTLQVYDIVGDQLVARGAVQLPDADGKIVAAGGLVYAAASQNNPAGGYVTVDVSDPDNPRVISEADGPITIGVPRFGLAVTGSGLGLLAGSSGSGAGVDLFDARDPENTFNFLTRFRTPGVPRDVAVADGIAVVATDAGLAVLNFRSADTGQVPPTVSLQRLPTEAPAGGRLPVRVSAADDQQVARVELLLNGAVVAASSAPPFDLSVVLPAGAGPVTLQARATDTGGNVGLSDAITITLQPDTAPPTVATVSLPAGSVSGRRLPPVLVRFSEPLDPASATADRFRLVGPAGELTGTARPALGGRGVVITFPELSADGDYQLVVSGEVRDGAGNPVGADAVTAFRVAGEVVSRFDAGTDGWAVVDGATGPTFVPNGGNPGGYITATEAAASIAWYWQAPAEFLGPKRAAAGGLLSFDLRVRLPGNATEEGVLLTGGGLTLEYRLPATPTADWQTYRVQLAPDRAWTVRGTNRAATAADFVAVLSDLTDLRIRGEYSTGDDSADLDNVVLQLGAE